MADTLKTWADAREKNTLARTPNAPGREVLYNVFFYASAHAKSAWGLLDRRVSSMPVSRAAAEAYVVDIRASGEFEDDHGHFEIKEATD